MTLEELSVRFTADAQPLIERLNELSALMRSAAAQAEKLTDAYRACGENAGSALAGGLLSRKDAVVQSARLVAEAAGNALRQALDIHSPSRVTMKMGERFDEGFVKGLTGGRAAVKEAALGIGSLSLDALSLPQMKSLPAAFKGLTKKMMMLVIVMLGTALDRMLNTDSICRIAVIGFYAANEGLSILENALALGVPVPDSLRRLLDTLREKGNGEDMPEGREK